MFRWIIIFFLLLIFPAFITATTTDSNFFMQREVLVGFYDNDFFPNRTPYPPHPLFWQSRVRIDGGLTFAYQYLVFHTEKYFSVNLGTSLSEWMLQSQVQMAASFFFVVHIWLFHTATFNPYFAWSIAGPTLLSRQFFGHANLGGHFTFQDFMGLGAILGRAHHVDLSVNIYHYSNGDFFVHNDGFDVPLVLAIGYLFNT